LFYLHVKLRMKKLYIGELTEIFLAIINNQQVLVVKKGLEKIIYISIPNCIKVKKENNFLLFDDKSEQKNFFANFLFKLSGLLEIKNVIKKKLILKGIGYKMSFSTNLENIVFKLGYSHLIVLPIPEQIFNVSIVKNLISMQSYDITFLGNFLAKIRGFRVPDSYKGKGFLRKNEKLILKQLKKK
jgi:large subunit ribosomal protein L6